MEIRMLEVGKFSIWKGDLFFRYCIFCRVRLLDWNDNMLLYFGVFFKVDWIDIGLYVIKLVLF